MPYINSYNVNEEHLREVLRCKRNIVGDSVVKIAPGICSTYNPDSKLEISEWFKYIRGIKNEK